jgi:hypothetical protein
MFSKPLVDAADIVTGVDHDGFARLLIAQNRAVALQGTYGKSLKNHSHDYCRFRGPAGRKAGHVRGVRLPRIAAKECLAAISHGGYSMNKVGRRNN